MTQPCSQAHCHFLLLVQAAESTHKSHNYLVGSMTYMRCKTPVMSRYNADKYPVCHFANSSADAVHLFLPSCTMDLGLRYMSNRAWQKAFDWTRRLGVAELKWVKPGGYTSEVREPSTAQHDTAGYLACNHGCQILRDPYSKQP